MTPRAGGIDRLVLTGIDMSGVVLSTLREAADPDLGFAVRPDGRLDADVPVWTRTRRVRAGHRAPSPR
ncbi:hypothetical protein [Streptomyces sp. NBC_00016]|uniref:hypothetical protein n=1 Tax=Streptomyces sp. NBC_00016 TaxID=2975622 RepID=UPI00386C546B